MIFLHTSDWHLGAKEGEYDLGADQRFFIDEIWTSCMHKSSLQARSAPMRRNCWMMPNPSLIRH